MKLKTQVRLRALSRGWIILLPFQIIIAVIAASLTEWAYVLLTPFIFVPYFFGRWVLLETHNLFFTNSEIIFGSKGNSTEIFAFIFIVGIWFIWCSGLIIATHEIIELIKKVRTK